MHCEKGDLRLIMKSFLILNDPILNKIQNDLIKQYQCHTIILYGSRARGDSTITSDYDIVAIRDQGDLERDCHLIDGFYLDIFIYPESMIQNPDNYLIRIKDGIILCQKDNLGTALLDKIHTIFNAGPMPTPEWEKHEINHWVMKMFQRAKQNDIEGNFRRHWLLHDLLESYFKLRNFWYLGPKESFCWLKNNDTSTYIAFDNALKKDAGYEEIKLLIDHVIIFSSGEI